MERKKTNKQKKREQIRKKEKKSEKIRKKKKIRKKETQIKTNKTKSNAGAAHTLFRPMAVIRWSGWARSCSRGCRRWWARDCRISNALNFVTNCFYFVRLQLLLTKLWWLLLSRVFFSCNPTNPNWWPRFSEGPPAPQSIITEL